MKHAGFLCAVAIAACSATAAAEPVLGVAGTMPSSGDYGEVLAALGASGIAATSLTLFWDQFDTGGAYIATDDWPAIANAVYPSRGISLALTISVIDTVADRRPVDLRALDWDDPAVITRFTAFLDAVLGRMPDVEVLSLSIGNEVDGLLRGEDWWAYSRFFDAVAAHVARTRPDLPVGVTMTWEGLRARPEARALAARGDGWFVTYYPLGPDFGARPPAAATADLARMHALAGDSPLFLVEAGYPSGGCGGSPEAQAAFVAHLLAANDPRLRLVMLTWMHDLPPEAVAAYAHYYGIADPCFLGYLATLGLRSFDGEDKPAFALLRAR